MSIINLPWREAMSYTTIRAIGEKWAIRLREYYDLLFIYLRVIAV